MWYDILGYNFSGISLIICYPFMPFLEIAAEDDAKLWVCSAINLLHLVRVLIVVKGSQVEPEIVVYQYY